MHFFCVMQRAQFTFFSPLEGISTFCPYNILDDFSCLTLAVYISPLVAVNALKVYCMPYTHTYYSYCYDGVFTWISCLILSFMRYFLNALCFTVNMCQFCHLFIRVLLSLEIDTHFLLARILCTLYILTVGNGGYRHFEKSLLFNICT